MPMRSTRDGERVALWLDFEFDLRTLRLRRRGIRLRLEQKPAQFLARLLEQPGEVVTRDELVSLLWPGEQHGDFDQRLNKAVHKARCALGDDPANPRFIQTLSRYGHRFIADVEFAGGNGASAPETTPTKQNEDLPLISPVEMVATGEEAMIESANSTRRGGVWWKIGTIVLAVSVVALAAVVTYRWHRQQQPQKQAVLTPVPFTALPGLAGNPAFSPDGSRIAFAWSPAPQAKGSRQLDLYVKALGSETLLRLTRHPSDNLFPAWSPDGTHIAFRRVASHDSGIYMVPALGGPEQELHPSRALDSPIGWSPDGKWIAFADLAQDDSHTRVYLLSTETLATRRIPVNPLCAGEDLPAFSHNGKYLAYWCSQDKDEAALGSVSLSDGKLKMVTPFWTVVPTGLTWSADDLRLVYSRLNGTVQRFNGTDSTKVLGEVSVANGSEKLLGLEGFYPAVSSKGDKLAYATQSVTTNLWRRDLLHPKAPAVELISSSRPQYDAQYSPDGRHIAFDSLRSGVQTVWISDEDGGNLAQISDPGYVSGSPQWSPDGKKIAFDSLRRNRWEIYVADAAGGKPEKLVTNISSIIRPSWSRDGKWIYFVANEPVNHGIYRCPASGGDATIVWKAIHATNPQESFDGKTVYFVAATTLKTVALQAQPGTETEVDPSLRIPEPQYWALSPRGIYFVPAEAPDSVRYFEFASRRIRTVFAADRQLGLGLSVSPDVRWILYAQKGDLTGDIMLVDHFR